jgi:hypothetical protein
MRYLLKKTMVEKVLLAIIVVAMHAASIEFASDAKSTWEASCALSARTVTGTHVTKCQKMPCSYATTVMKCTVLDVRIQNLEKMAQNYASIVKLHDRKANQQMPFASVAGQSAETQSFAHSAANVSARSVHFLVAITVIRSST